MAINAIRSLYFSKFRQLMVTHILICTGFWIQQIVIGWMVYEKTKSPLLTSLALAVDTIPILFGGFLGGVFVDRLNPKSCIIFVTGGQFFLVSILTTIMFLDIFSLWYIYIIIFFIGFTWAIYDPSKITLGMKLVDKNSISNIFGMWIAGFNIPRVLSTVLAGYLIVFLGTKYTLLLELLVIFLSFLSILLLKYEHNILKPENLKVDQIVDDVKELFRTIRYDNLLTGFFLLSFIPILLLVPSTTGLLPVYASDILKLDARGLGFLQSSCGLGQIMGILIVGFAKQQYMGKYATLAIFGSACSAILFAFSEIFFLSIIFIILVNICIAIIHNATGYGMFSIIAERFRGRLAGLQVSSFGFFIFGTTFSGSIANVYGPSTSTISCMIIIMVISTIVIATHTKVYSEDLN